VFLISITSSFIFLNFSIDFNKQNEDLLKNAWQRIYKSDQTHRGPEEDPELDCQNLIKACKLVEKYGYPTKEKFGKSAFGAWLPWIHANGHEAALESFSIIEEGHRIKEINDDQYLNYFLKSLVQQKFAIEIRRREPTQKNIDYYLKRLNIPKRDSFNYSEIENQCNRRDTIPVEEIIYTLSGYSHYYQQKVIKSIVFKSKGKFYYSGYLSSNNPRLVVFTENTFHIEPRWEGEYFEIVDESQILLKNKEGKTLITYEVLK